MAVDCFRQSHQPAFLCLPQSTSHRPGDLGPWLVAKSVCKYVEFKLVGREGGFLVELPAQQRNSLGVLKTRAKEGGAAAVLKGRWGEKELALSASGWAQPARRRQVARIDLLRGLHVSSGLPSVAKHRAGSQRGTLCWCWLMSPLLGSPGGLTAVIYTDALQTVIMVGGALVLMFLGKAETRIHPPSHHSCSPIRLGLSPPCSDWNFPECTEPCSPRPYPHLQAGIPKEQTSQYPKLRV